MASTAGLKTALSQAKRTIPGLFFQQAQRYGRKPVLWHRRSGRYESMAWSHAEATVRSLAAFLLSRDVKPGDRIAILSENRPEWGLADLAIQAIGAWTVPIYASLPDRDVLQILSDCEPVACIASNHEQLNKFRACRQHLACIRLLICLDDETALEARTEHSWHAAVQQGIAELPRRQDALEQRLQRLNPDETATLLYTSGTTGEPKGVMLSHNNFLSNAAACLDITPISDSDLHLSFLPLSHVFERMAGWYLMLMAGAGVAYAESMDTIPQNMPEIRPTVMLGVPRFFEKLYAKIQDGIANAPAGKQRLITWALRVGQAAGAARLSHRPISLGLRLQHAVADRLVFHKLRGRLGGRLRFFVSGSAPLSAAIGEFFYAAGITILEGYGLTETSPVIAVNRLDALRFGTVGKPIPGVEVRIAEDGEILTRGPHIMQGYYRKPQQTQDVMTDGWFHTGDIGSFDADGFLRITDRKKDLIKTAGGKFVAPQKLENLFIADPYIAQAFVFGDRERYCVALVVPRFDRLAEYAASQGLAGRSPQELAQSPAIQDFLWKRVQALQQPLASFEQVKAIAVLDQEFSQASGELTPTMKVKRSIIAAKHQEMLHRLYQAPPSS